jgi:NodT family efflux transporter outer membrane factor (OMF) lipoprotein
MTSANSPLGRPGAGRTSVALCAAVALLLGACASPGDIGPTRSLAAPVSADSSSATPWPDAHWWSGYGDPVLDRLVEQALAGQPGLRAAQARLQQAQAAVDANRAAQAPQVNLAVDLTDQRFTKNGLVPPPLAGATYWNNNAQFGGSWEVDLFGRQGSAIAAAIGQQRAGQAEFQAARVLLASQVAGAYFQLARLVEARQVAAQTLAQREQILSLVKQRIGAGLDTLVDQRQAEGLIAQSQVEIEALAEAIARARHALAELAGQYPQALDSLSPTLAGVHAAPLPAALPADLLGRRADLVAQRWRVEAALRDVDVARAQFMPNINLVGFVGLSSLGLDRLLQVGALSTGVGPALRLPIFDGGRLRANLKGKSAEVDAAIESYDANLLRALREVADEIDGLQSLARQQRPQADATAAAEAAHDLALQRYRAGLGNFLTVLTAQTNVLAQRRAAIDLKARQLGGEVALQRALGGGFHADPDDLPVAQAAGATPR